jgi:hypothetical protein
MRYDLRATGGDMNTVGWSEDFDTNEEVNVGPYME